MPLKDELAKIPSRDELAKIPSRFAFEYLQRQFLIDVGVPAVSRDGDEQR